MTRIDIEVLCPLCNGDGEEKTFKRFFQISLDLDLSQPRTLKSNNVCAFCKDPLPVKVRIEMVDEPCCEQPLVRNHFDLIPVRKHNERLVHRKCGNCNTEILIKENVIIGE